ncbi:ImmA/IrrE family metallo-endopeptidase [Microvirga sp. RSM25]|jgi:hypothetical protein|uniref:ImmA/IrrE family metallo-endopeptidase n=1 Tax=Microvirga sp. RSM25 TaxID=3273802 RepID=UPI00384C282C
MGQDFKARHQWSEGQLAEDALKVRRKHGYRDNTLSFDILDCLTKLTFTRSVPVKYFELTDAADPAYVKFNPLELHIAREIRRSAEDGNGYARLVVAHEIAHLRLHSDGVNSFSPFNDHEERWFIKEQSVEWQANTWALYFLLPNAIVEMLRSTDAIVEMCNVDPSTASMRLAQIQDRENRQAMAGLCSECGSFNLICEGQIMRCGTCGSTTRRG